jgi:hypothetical protein
MHVLFVSLSSLMYVKLLVHALINDRSYELFWY